MKPYLAILIDSFWEAVTSKVLWALLVGWSLLLAGLAPFGYITERSFQLTRGDIRNPLGLSQKLAKGLTPAGTKPQKAISSRLNDALKARLNEANDKPDRDDRLQKIGQRELINELNRLLKDRELYQEDAFETAANRESLKPILAKEQSQRTAEELELLNRELLRIAYSADLVTPRGEQVWVGYAGIKLGDALPLSRREFNIVVERVALEIIIRLGLSFVTVFIGIIITSPMIPETFRSGSLHLLLSKPVSRPLIFLTKFVGGTIFVLVNIAYLLIALYFLVGWRLDIWNVGLIYCIPLLLFVFTIFYSVSALVGLIWNNPIICVVVCVIFWIFCLIVGVLESFMKMPADFIPQIVRFQVVEEDVLGITQAGGVKVWNEKFQVWQPAAESREGDTGRVLGPIYDRERNRLIFRSDFLNGLGEYETRTRNFVVVDLTRANEVPDAATKPTKPPATTSDQPESNSSATEADSRADDNSIPKNADEARRKSHWNSENGFEPPMLMLDLLELGGRTLAITRNGIFEIDWALQEAVEEAKTTTTIFGNLPSWLNRIQPKPLKELTPPDYVFGDRVRIAAASDQKRLYIYNSNVVDCLELNEAGDRFRVVHSITLDGDARQPALIGANDKYCVVARESLPLLVLPADLSAADQKVSLPSGSDPRQITTVGGSGQFSIVTHDGEWFTLDPTKPLLERVRCAWQGSISGVTWLTDKKAWVGVRPNQAMLMNFESGRVERTLTPTMSRLDFFYHYILRPLYVVSPKPSSLNGVLQKLLSRQAVGQTQLFSTDMSSGRREVEIWQPIISNLIFVTTLLAIGCIYVWRREY